MFYKSLSFATVVTNTVPLEDLLDALASYNALEIRIMAANSPSTTRNEAEAS